MRVLFKMPGILVADGDAVVWIVPAGTAGKFKSSISPAEVLFLEGRGFLVFFGGDGKGRGDRKLYIYIFFFTVTNVTGEDIYRCATYDGRKMPC